MFPGKVLVITGMHRSGTSFLANVFQSGGVLIGDDLMPGSEGNPKGFFEDRGFVDFHDRVIRRADPSRKYLWEPRRPIELIESEIDVARELVERRRASPVWAWKDPRTVLFLDFWKGLLPDASFLFVFRRPDQVVDSLRRRGDRQLRTRLVGKSIWPGPGRLALFRYQYALSAWVYYNQRIMDFVEHHPDCSCLVEIGAFLEDPDRFLDHVREHLKVPLQPVDVFEIFDSSLMASDPHPRVTRAVRRRQDVTRLYERLRCFASEHSGAPSV